METYKGSLFYNYQSFLDTLIIVIDNSFLPTRINKIDDVVGLYYKDRLIGVNIFNSNRFLKLRLNGLVHNPNQPLINLIHTVILNSIKEDVLLVDSKVMVGKIESVDDGSYNILISSSQVEKAGALYEEDLNKDDYVLVCPKGNRLDNGEMSDTYLSKDQKYLIIGKEDDDIDGEAELGQDTYSLKEN